MNGTVDKILNPVNRLTGILEHYFDYMDRTLDFTKEFEGWMSIYPNRQQPERATSKGQLDRWRDLGRRMHFSNPFAINGIQNMVNFTVGSGFRYRVVDPQARSAYIAAIEEAHEHWRQWVEDSDWDDHERESMMRAERDGEAFIRFFPDFNNQLHVRQVDPFNIVGDTLPDMPSSEFGLITDTVDNQHVLAYVIDNNELVDPSLMVHIKQNVTSDVWRGIPTFLPCLEHLERAKKLLETMSKMVEVQAALAAVREHPEGVTGTKIRSWLDSTESRTPTTHDGETIRQIQWQPGTIIDVPAGQKYHFPSAGKSAADITVAVNANLRAAAARVSMPEFMFSMNAADSNYASLKAADHPGVRSNQVRQVFYGKRYKWVFKKVIRIAIARGQVSDLLLDPTLHWSVIGPTVKSSDHFSETRSNELMLKRGVMSARTWADREGLDYDREIKRNQDDEVIIPEGEKNKSLVGESIGKGGDGNDD